MIVKHYEGDDFADHYYLAWLDYENGTPIVSAAVNIEGDQAEFVFVEKESDVPLTPSIWRSIRNSIKSDFPDVTRFFWSMRMYGETPSYLKDDAYFEAGGR